MFGNKNRKVKQKDYFAKIKKDFSACLPVKPDSLFNGTYGGPAMGLPDTRNGFSRDRQNLKLDAIHLNRDIHKVGKQSEKENQK